MYVCMYGRKDGETLSKTPEFASFSLGGLRERERERERERGKTDIESTNFRCQANITNA